MVCDYPRNCEYPRCECMHGPEDCVFQEKNSLAARKATTDVLLDRDCAILDGRCDCPRKEGHSLPECKKYATPTPV